MDRTQVDRLAGLSSTINRQSPHRYPDSPTCRWLHALQVRLASSAAVAVHQPDLVLVLGDQFDEGGLPTASTDWEVGALVIELHSDMVILS